jgi:hypothetical protein
VKESQYAMHLNYNFTFSLPFPFTMPRQEVQNLVFIEKWLPHQVKIPIWGHSSKYVQRKCMTKSNLSTSQNSRN